MRTAISRTGSRIAGTSRTSVSFSGVSFGGGDESRR